MNQLCKGPKMYKMLQLRCQIHLEIFIAKVLESRLLGVGLLYESVWKQTSKLLKVTLKKKTLCSTLYTFYRYTY